jgi:hypothetical protein
MPTEPVDQPQEMTPHERVRAIASILAAGLLRLEKQPKNSAETGFEDSQESGETRLEVGHESWLSVHSG